MTGNAPWLDNTIGSWVGGILAAATLGICFWLYNYFGELNGIAVAHAGFWGWSIVTLASVLALMLGWLFFDRQRLQRRWVQNGIELKPAACQASFVHPSNHALVPAGWFSVEGNSTGAPQYYWLLNHKTGQYWPHGPIGINHDGTWKVGIYLSSAPAAREVEVTLAWVSEEVHSFLENWKTKCKETTNWNGLKVKFPPGHFVPLETRTFGVLPVPEKATTSITSVTLEHVVTRGTTFEIDYEIEVTGEPAKDVWLGVSFQDASGRHFYNTSEDKIITLAPGRKPYRRSFTIAKDATPGNLEQSITLTKLHAIAQRLRTSVEKVLQ